MSKDEHPDGSNQEFQLEASEELEKQTVEFAETLEDTAGKLAASDSDSSDPWVLERRHVIQAASLLVRYRSADEAVKANDAIKSVSRHDVFRNVIAITSVAEVVRLRSELSRVRLHREVITAPFLISFKTEDGPFADEVCTKLKKAGVSVFLAPKSIKPGSDWEDSLFGALRGSCVVLFLVTSRSVSSTW